MWEGCHWIVKRETQYTDGVCGEEQDGRNTGGFVYFSARAGQCGATERHIVEDREPIGSRVALDGA